MEQVALQGRNTDTLKLDDGREICFNRHEVLQKGPRTPIYLLTLKDDRRLPVTAAELVRIGVVPALRTTEIILETWRNGEFFPLIVYGASGKGKSAYSITLLSEVYGETGYDSHVVDLTAKKKVLIVWRRNWDAWKEHLVFLSEDFFKRVDESQELYEKTGMPIKLIVWDDAGLWISRYRWMEDFSKLFSDYLNVIRTDFASVVFTTPSAKKLLKDVRQFPEMHTGRPAALTGHSRWARYININEGWESPDFKKDGVKTIAKDFFSARLPDHVFAEYEPVRRAYAKIAKERVKQAIANMIRDGSMSYAKRYLEQAREAGIDIDEDETKVAPARRSVFLE